jgi:hypothetical protein
MKAYGKVDVSIHIFFISALAGGEWSASRPAVLPSAKELPVPLDRKLMNTRGGPDDVDKRKLLTLP